MDYEGYLEEKRVVVKYAGFMGPNETNKQVQYETHIHEDERHIYMKMKDNDSEHVPWKRMFYGNVARPRTLMTLWLTCHGKLPTKDKFHQFGLLDSSMCCFCSNVETIEHLFFECMELKTIWKKVLSWIQVNHDPKVWHDEME